MTEAEAVLARWGRLKSKRAPLDSLYSDITTYFIPRESDLVRQSGGDVVGPACSAQVRYLQLLAAGLFSNTVSPGQEWFALRADDEEMNEDPAVGAYLTDVADTVLKALQGSNFLLQVHELLTLYAGLGTGVLWSEWATGQGLVFRSWSVRDCWLEEGPSGLVDTVFRSFRWSARQAVAEFGKDVHSEVARAAAEGRGDEESEYLHAVYPLAVPERKADGTGEFRWASVWVDTARQVQVRVGRYETLPFAVPRFYVSPGQAYGRSVTFECLPDVRMLSRATAALIDATEMATNPPVFLPDSDAARKTDLRPGAVNYYRVADGAPVFYQPGGNVRLGVEFVEGLKQDVREALFVDLFLAISEMDRQGKATATEILERVAEKVQALSPVVSRLQAELYTPVVERAKALLEAAGQLPERPAELEGKTWRVVYTSRLDARLAQVETTDLLTTLRQAVEVAASLVQAPDIPAVFKVGRVLRFLARNQNVDPELLRTQEEEAEYRQAVAADEQQQKAQEMAASAVKPVDLQVPTRPGTPLASMLGA